MATNKNFVVKNGLIVGGQEVISSSGVVTSAALGGQTLSSTDSPTFANLTVSNDLAVSGDLNLTGDLNITGDVNTLSVTDLDVTDQTITLGAGQVESASGGSGIIVDGSLASILWDETNTEWDFNNSLHVTTPSTTTAFITAEETSGATVRMAAGGSSAYIGTISNHPLRFLVNSLEKASLTATGDFTVTNDVKLTTTNPRIDYDGGSSGSLRFFSTSANQERARITSSGNFGIGTINPSSKLHIQGNSDDGDAYCQLIIEDTDTDSGSQVPSIQFMGNGSNTVRMRGTDTQGLVISGSSAQGDDLVVQAGAVGIGTDGPSAPLHVTSTNSTSIKWQRTGVSAKEWGLVSDNDQTYLYNFTDGVVSSSFHNDGRVGIGKTGPGYALDVYDVGEAWIRVDSSHTTESTANSGLRFAHGGVNHGVLYHRGSDDTLLYFDNILGSTRFKLDSSGNFGIGIEDTTPTYRLHVNSSGTNVVADFESTDTLAAIRLRDNNGNAELEYTGAAGTNNGDFSVNHNGSGNRSFHTSMQRSLFYTNNTVHSNTDTDFDIQFINVNTSNYGPRLRLQGAGQSGTMLGVPWSSQGGYDIGSIWFDSAEGPSRFGAGIAGYAESDFNASDTPAGLAFYTTPDGTGTNQERLRMAPNGYHHFSPSESNCLLHIGSQGGLFGGNSSNWVRANGANMMYNAGGGQHIWEVSGVQKLLIDGGTGQLTSTTLPSGDGYTLRSLTNNGADPGLSIFRSGQAGFGIAVRTATTNYADFLVSSGGEAAYTESGSTNAPLRIYQNNSVWMPGSHLGFNSGIGWGHSGAGRIYIDKNSGGAGDETIIVNLLSSTASNDVGILQFRKNAGVFGNYLLANTTNGIYNSSGSDYRFKDNVTDFNEDSLSKICQLRPITYTHTESYDPEDTDTVHLGFIAHEVEEIYPDVVTGTKDAVYTEDEVDSTEDDVSVGDPKYQSVSYFNKEWTVRIIRAIQQLKAENDELRARIAALEE